MYGKNAEDCVLSIHDPAYFAMCSTSLSCFWWLFQWMKADFWAVFWAVFSNCIINLCSELLRLEVLMPHFLPRHCMNHCRLGKMHRTFLSCMLTFRPQRNHQKKMHWVIFLSVSSIHSFKNSWFSVCFMHDWYEVGKV